MPFDERMVLEVIMAYKCYFLLLYKILGYYAKLFLLKLIGIFIVCFVIRISWHFIIGIF